MFRSKARRSEPTLECSPQARQSGAAMVELAIVAPCAIVLVFAVIQLGLMFSAKEIVNEATFLAARAGSMQNARVDKMTDVLVKGLIPLYQDSTQTNDLQRLSLALVRAKLDTLCVPVVHCFLKLEVLNPTPAAFEDFGLTSPAAGGRTYIPNDNLEYRPHDVVGPNSGMTLQDANALKVKVTYGYELKVPLMKTIMKAIMCGVDSGIDAFGSGTGVDWVDDCSSYYSRGRVPIIAYSIVQMQTPSWRP